MNWIGKSVIVHNYGFHRTSEHAIVINDVPGSRDKIVWMTEEKTIRIVSTQALEEYSTWVLREHG